MKGRDLLKNLCLSCAALCLVILGTEAVLRVTHPHLTGGARTFHEALEESKRRLPGRDSAVIDIKGLVEPAANPKILYQLKPGLNAVFKGAPVSVNRMGYRDLERSISKPEGTVRIAILGDSVTFGWGVPFEETFGQVLERKLNARPGDVRFEVLNFGVPGYHTGQEVAALEADGLRYDPDVIILTIVANDFIPETYLESFGWQGPRSSLAVVNFIRLRLGLMNTRSAEVRFTTEHFETLKTLAEPRGIPVFGFLFMAQIERGTGTHPAPMVNRKLTSTFRDNGFIYLDYVKAVRRHLRRNGLDDESSFRISRKDHHPNAIGHDFIARFLSRGLRQAGIFSEQGGPARRKPLY